jgi:hypothetical protein
MKTLGDKTKPIVVLGVLVLVAIVAVSPHAFAQQGPSSSGQGQQNGVPLGSSYNAPAGTPQASPSSGGVTYNDSDNPYGPLSGMTWALGLAAAGVMSGIGVWTAVRKH